MNQSCDCFASFRVSISQWDSSVDVSAQIRFERGCSTNRHQHPIVVLLICEPVDSSEENAVVRSK